MKLSPIVALIAETWAQGVAEAGALTDTNLDELFAEAVNDVGR